ncbi:GNAT family N-acetyltransferase [Kribbella catacumbae]|uniref:GNAT family N-acetyltransferase n=1 Tax=Kribbella catacumbae TaxID=460086 RepID=UPI000365E3EA|nr:GNAT family N-acetyltransferase [Kribbella catacumbae]
MTSTALRPRTAADLDDCVRLLAEVHKSGGYPVNWPADPAAWLTPENALGSWVLTLDGEIAGHLIVTAEGPDEALVERLFVDPRRTRAGLGRRLLEHAVAFAEKQGRQLALEVVDNHGAAISFYRNAGWRESGRTPIDWGGDQASALIRFEAPSSVSS